MPLQEDIPDDWREVLSAKAMEALHRLEGFLEGKANVLPPRERIFEALRLTPLSKVKVLMLGQDPYPTPGHANGLAFSVSPQTKLPGSLKNLFLGLSEDVGTPVPPHGDLTRWAHDGVLLLNTVLTVEAHEALSHRKQGWEEVTGEWISALALKTQPVVFFCMGKHAQALVDARVTAPHHLKLHTPHPSPLTRGAFLAAVRAEKPFSKVNAFLKQNGLAEIGW